MAGFAYADVEDVQRGFEKPIPAIHKPKVTEFLERASTRLSVIAKKRTGVDLRARWVAELPADDDDPNEFCLFVRDMVTDAAERKFRNPGGFSHENAGIFSVSRYEDFSKGRITFDPEDLELLDGLLETKKNETIRGPILTRVPQQRWP